MNLHLNRQACHKVAKDSFLHSLPLNTLCSTVHSTQPTTGRSPAQRVGGLLKVSSSPKKLQQSPRSGASTRLCCGSDTGFDYSHTTLPLLHMAFWVDIQQHGLIHRDLQHRDSTVLPLPSRYNAHYTTRKLQKLNKPTKHTLPKQPQPCVRILLHRFCTLQPCP